MVARADCVPWRWPAIRGRCLFCAQRPLPSMMTATCLGKRVKSSFSRSRASSEVTGPSDSSVGPCGGLWVIVCDTKLSADGFSCESLYAAKLTYAVGAAQWQRAQPNTVKLSARRRTLLKEGGVADKQRQDDHGDRGDPSNDVVPEGVHVLAH